MLPFIIHMENAKINWYPGHMAKARRKLQEHLRVIDIVVEILDARLPKSSRNPDFDSLLMQKTRLVVLNKSDLADEHHTKRWLKWYSENNVAAIAIDSRSKGQRTKAIKAIEEAAKPIVARYAAKGVNKTIRALVAGIPNSGKSTFINLLAASKSAKAGDMPGVTKGNQWVKIARFLELLDSPGLLWPKLDDQRAARRLAFIHAINDEIMPLEELAVALLSELLKNYGDFVKQRYNITDDIDNTVILQKICRQRGFLLKGGEPDTERAARTVLDDFRKQRLGRITLESVDELNG